ncbi:MAG: cation-translocating P-type ATPase [Proteobacteria bacterium]|nr:cation-translocating P-type ATPase [Pseudomonadota bacterium]MBU1737957.1 cation-translocating P-type ATPase [Pseudomonadota bacterium]
MPYRRTPDEILTDLKSTREGLTAAEAALRQQQYGSNELETRTAISPVAIFFSQFKSFIIYILLFAVAFSLLIGEYVDSVIILIILLANALIGFFQELSANRSLEALKKMTAIQATVFRNGTLEKVDAKELVPGDVIKVEAGDKVPADARLLEAVRLKADEAVLTGESVPTEKNQATITREVQPGDRHNMLFTSTSVVSGNGLAVVTSTGMTTEIGKITRLIKETVEEMTPLQKRLDRFGKKLGLVIIAVCLFIFVLLFSKDLIMGKLSVHSFISFAFIAISLAVAAVPTALPAVVTIALSIGVKRLLAKKTLVRRLSSVETLGSCDLICTDKTGTLTENMMTVRFAWTPDGEAEFSGNGYNPQGSASTPLEPLLYRTALACNNSSLQEREGEWLITGDPTEAALLTSAAKAGVVFSGDRLDELPFDSDRKMMSVLVAQNEGRMMYTKGAPDQILDRCNRVLITGSEMEMTDRMKKEIHARNDYYGAKALRVLAFACKRQENEEDFSEDDLVFIGLQAMIDPPRADVVDSLRRTARAGIRVIMITGDYQETARAIGSEIGITGKLCSGVEMDGFDDQTLIERLRDNTNLFSRVVPEHKQRIVSALQKMGHIVAMTGDGVNDAPALKKANIGVAVGSGTDVAKEASDFVLLDNSFTHIVNAIEEGRGIYDNIQKSIMLLLSGNFGEVLIIFLAVILGLNLPLTAVLLLWINMVTDGAPALAFSVDPYGSDIMSRPPKSKDEEILPAEKLAMIGLLGILGTALALLLFTFSGGRSSDAAEIIHGQTMVFNFVVFFEVVLVFIIRQGYRVAFFSNRWVWGSVFLSIFLQALIMYTPLHKVFRIVPLNLAEIMIIVGGGFAVWGVSFLLRNLILKFSRSGHAAV